MALGSESCIAFWRYRRDANISIKPLLERKHIRGFLTRLPRNGQGQASQVPIERELQPEAKPE
jgi:hypothetical protein